MKNLDTFATTTTSIGASSSWNQASFFTVNDISSTIAVFNTKSNNNTGNSSSIT
jgi:hypothetical protein